MVSLETRKLVMNHVPVDGRKTTGSAGASPSKLNGTGTSPFVPNGKLKNELSSLRRTNEKPVDGRQTAISVFPSPVKSAGTILSEAAPNWAATVAPVELR